MSGAETARRRVVQRRMGGAERVLPLELYCVGLLTLLRGTLDWIELAMLSPIDKKKLLNTVAISAGLKRNKYNFFRSRFRIF